MQLKNEAEWQSYVTKNTDPYGKACVDYALQWAELMESRIAGGEVLTAIAEETSHEADTDGITGFMYGCAVQMLALCWVHGEPLRQWHNSKFGAEKANARQGAVANPAILVIRED